MNAREKTADLPLVSWGVLKSEAAALSDKEPLLRSLLSKFFVDDGSLPEAIAMILADALQATNVSAAGLNDLFADARQATRTSRWRFRRICRRCATATRPAPRICTRC